MTSNEAIQKIRVLLGLETAHKFEAVANLVDGTPVHVETDFEVGVQLHVVQPDGTFVPAPEGEHTLEDGRTLVVDADGIIVEVREAAPAEETPAEPTAEELEEVVVEDVPAPIVEVTEEIVDAIVEAMAPVISQIEEMKKQMETLTAKFQKFSNEPAAEPVRNNFKAENMVAKTAAENRLETLVQIRKNKK